MMNDREIYAYWVRNCDAIDQCAMIGAITDEDVDRLVRNMEERLGVNKWSVERWRAAANGEQHEHQR